MSNIVNQQLREETEHMQKVKMEEILEVHRLQDQQLEEYAAFLLASDLVKRKEKANTYYHRKHRN